MKQFDNEMINQAFKDYYTNNRVVATHIFIYSESQIMYDSHVRNESYVRNIAGVLYTETRSRDHVNQNFTDDAMFLCVGTFDEIKYVKTKTT